VFTNELRVFLTSAGKPQVNKVCIIKLAHSRGSLQTWRRTMRGLRTVLEEKLLSFYAYVGEFSKILIEGGHWRVFGRSGCRY
jgi:hypothetical protein